MIIDTNNKFMIMTNLIILNMHSTTQNETKCSLTYTSYSIVSQFSMEFEYKK